MRFIKPESTIFEIWFWKKFEFVHDKISQHATLILKKKNNKVDIGEIRHE